MRTFMTGDLHGYVDERFDKPKMERLGVEEGDLLVVLGDMGILFNTEPQEWAKGDMYWADSMFFVDLAKSWPGDVAFVDGNHENFPILEALPAERRWGGKVGVVAEGIYHLLRGGTYDLPVGEGTARAWCMGGAWSIDQNSRTEGVDWWPQEMPDYGEIEAARESLAFSGWRADYILTHECPSCMRDALTRDSIFGHVPHRDRLQDFLDEVDEGASFERWYCGHYHVNRDVGWCHTCLFGAVVPLGQPAGEV